MTSFWRVVNEVIRDSDVILEVLDARFPEQTRNKEIEEKIAKCRNKKLIFVLNKSDLLNVRFSEVKFDREPYVFVSAKENLGTTKLRRLLSECVKDKPIIVGVLGFPNTGKSSLINTLRHKKVSLTSPNPGFTRGMQKIKISKDIYLMDTPGVFSYGERNEKENALTNVKDYRKVKDPETVALEILRKVIESDPRLLEALYKVKPKEDPEETLELIAKKFNWIIKGGKPNIDQTARKIIQDWQRGKIIL